MLYITLDDLQNSMIDGTNPIWRSEAIGWITMYASIFFFAAWGPLSTTFILPAELFPSSWRVTGYGLCAATGSLGSVVGIWIFVYARYAHVIRSHLSSSPPIPCYPIPTCYFMLCFPDISSLNLSFSLPSSSDLFFCFLFFSADR